MPQDRPPTELHLTPQIIEKLTLREPLTPAEAQFVARHLIAFCAECRERVEDVVFLQEIRAAFREMPGEPLPTPPDPDLQALYARVRQRHEAAQTLLETLLAEPQERRILLVENSPRFHTPEVADALLERSFAAVAKDPREAEALADLALRVVRYLEPATYAERKIHDLTARAWAQVGNARRVASNLKGADEALLIAELCFEKGTGRLQDRVRLLEFCADLRRDQRRFDEALELLDHALVICRGMGDPHHIGRVLVEKAMVYNAAGDVETAIQLLREAVPLIDKEREPRLALSARQHLLCRLTELGHFAAARELVPEVWRLAVEHGGRLDHLRVRWAEARIALGTGDLEKAEVLLQEVRRGFEEARIPYDVALASLDLAAVYVRQKRTEEVQALAREMVATFQILEIHREAMTSLLLFQQAAESGNVTLETIRDLAAGLRRFRRRPAPKPERPS